jgi:hypothetical protein
MKKLKLIILAFFSVLMIVVSCAKIDGTYRSTTIPTNDRGEYAILFNNSSVATKAAVTTTAGNGYDEFSLYAWNSSNDTIMNPFRVTGVAANSYKYEDVDGQKLQYFKNSADSYSFIGVIPTTDVKVKNGAVKVCVESFVVDDNRVSGTLTADSPKEFLWARVDVAKGNYNQPVNIPFKHGNALLYLGFISDDGNTQIIDYTASSTTVNTITKITAPVNRYGIVTSSNFNAAREFLTDDVIEEFNAKCNITELDGTLPDYTTPDTWGNINSTKPKKIITGDLNNNRWNEISSLSGYTANLFNSLVNVKAEYARPVHIEAIGGEIILFYVANIAHTNAETIYEEETITTGLPGIRVFSAQTDVTDGYAHLAHTKTADATVAAGLTFDNRVAVIDSIQFSLPGVVVPVGTTEAQAVYSPTTFYAIPGDAGLTHFVVKVSYTYKGTTVYDVRVPITLPAAGLEAGKYYKYIINIKSTANGTNNPDEANNEKDDIDIVDNPIQVTTTITDYENGHTQIITI